MALDDYCDIADFIGIFPEKDWQTSDGRDLWFSEMEDSHLLNCFKLTLRREQYPPTRMTNEILKRKLMDNKAIIACVPDPDAYGTPPGMEYSVTYSQALERYENWVLSLTRTQENVGS